MKSAIEIGEEILALPQVRMTDEGIMFLLCTMSENTGKPVIEKIAASLSYQILEKRCEFYGIEVSPWVMTFISSVLADRAGIVVLYAAACAAIHRKHGRVDFSAFAAMDAFGNGFPSQEDLFFVWKGQKIVNRKPGESDNMLDYPQKETKENADFDA